MKGRIRTGAAVVLTLALAAGGAGAIRRGIQAGGESLSGQGAREQAGLSSPMPLPAAGPSQLPAESPGMGDGETERLGEIDLAALRAVNPQVVGWLSLPGTNIDYPLVQGEDNRYYLDHSWDGRAAAAGAIFLEQGCSSQFTDFSTILYGHFMGDGSMFHALTGYGEQAFLEAHPRVYVALDEGVRVYGVFAALRVTVTDPVYWLEISEERHKRALIDFCLDGSGVESGLSVGVEDRLLLLSTCVGLLPSEERWVVAAVELGTVPAAANFVDFPRFTQ